MPTVVHEIPVQALPNKAEAARMLRVHKSRLSRLDDLPIEESGGRQYLLPETVLMLNRRFRHHVERALAQELIDHALANAPEFADAIRDRVRAWIRGAAAAHSADAMTRDQFLASWGAELNADEQAVLARVYDRADRAGSIPRLTAFDSEA